MARAREVLGFSSHIATTRRVARLQAFLLLVSVVATSCGSKEPMHTDETLDVPPPLARELLLAGEPGPNAVLHNLEAASLSLWYGNKQHATASLDRAIAEIETLYTGTDSAAAQARRLYHEEREKPYKGEPYERTMVYVYRALLDYGSADYANAAAMLRSAILQDAFADEQQNQCDFEVAEYLLARSILKDGGDSHLIDESYDRARRLAASHGTTLPPLRSEDNVLLLVEVGPAPFKVAQGESDELLVIGRRGADGFGATVSIDGTDPKPVPESGNLAYQAVTRGGRQFDFILAGKAYTKAATSAGGLTINQIGSAVGAAIPIVGTPIQLVGLIVKAAGVGVKARADTRYWRALPDSIHILPLRLTAGTHKVEIAFTNPFGQQGPRVEYRINVAANEPDTLVWVSSQDRWPERRLAFP